MDPHSDCQLPGVQPSGRPLPPKLLAFQWLMNSNSSGRQGHSHDLGGVHPNQHHRHLSPPAVMLVTAPPKRSGPSLCLRSSLFRLACGQDKEKSPVACPEARSWRHVLSSHLQAPQSSGSSPKSTLILDSYLYRLKIRAQNLKLRTTDTRWSTTLTLMAMIFKS